MRRSREQGAETLELVAALPLLALALAVVWQVVVLMRQQVEAEADARALARHVAACHTSIPSLQSIDDQVTDENAAVRVDSVSSDHGVRVTVTLPAIEVVPGWDRLSGAHWSVRATVVMEREPC